MCLIECLLNILDQVDSITKPDSGLLLNLYSQLSKARLRIAILGYAVGRFIFKNLNLIRYRKRFRKSRVSLSTVRTTDSKAPVAVNADTLRRVKDSSAGRLRSFLFHNH